MTSQDIRFPFGALHIDGGTKPRTAFARLLRIGASFQIEAGGVAVFSEPDFTVVEFAAALSHWLGTSPGTDFRYVSLEFGDEPMIQFLVDDDGRYMVTAEERPALRGAAENELRDASAQFCQSVRVRVRKELGVRVDDLLSGR